jgi:hypothetical protein
MLRLSIKVGCFGDGISKGKSLILSLFGGLMCMKLWIGFKSALMKLLSIIPLSFCRTSPRHEQSTSVVPITRKSKQTENELASQFARKNASTVAVSTQESVNVTMASSDPRVKSSAHVIDSERCAPSTVNAGILIGKLDNHPNQAAVF